MRIFCYSLTQAGRVCSCVTLAEILHTCCHKHIDRHQRVAAAERLAEEQLAAEILSRKTTLFFLKKLSLGTVFYISKLTTLFDLIPHFT